MLADLERALASLPSGYAVAVVLVTQEGLTYEQAAMRLGIAAGTVRSRISRGRQAIGAFLEYAELEEPPRIPLRTTTTLSIYSGRRPAAV